MKIKTKLLISVFIFIILVIALGFITYSGSQETNKRLKNAKTSNEIVRGLFELTLLRTDYLLYGEERAKVQWFLKYDSLGETIKKAEEEEEEERADLKDINQAYSELKPLFSELVNAQEMQPKNQEFEDRIKGQFLIKNQEILSTSQKLSNLDNTKATDAIEKNAVITISSLISITVLMLINLFILLRSVIKPIGELTKVIDHISKGELDAEIKPELKQSKDELGDLANAFERTIVSLKVAMKLTAPELKKALEKERESSLKRYAEIQTVLNESSLVSMTDMKGDITYVNPKFCEIAKYSKEELIGKNHRIVNSGFHSKEFFENLWKTISAGKIWKGTIRNKAKDGSIYWVRSVLMPTYGENSKINGYEAIRTPITDMFDEVELAIQNSKKGQKIDPKMARLIEDLRLGTYTINNWFGSSTKDKDSAMSELEKAFKMPNSKRF